MCTFLDLSSKYNSLEQQKLSMTHITTVCKLLSQTSDKHKRHLGMHILAVSHSHSRSSQHLTVLIYFSHTDISQVETTCSGFIL